MEIAVIGSNAFTLGFQLAGIRRIEEIEEGKSNTAEKMKGLLKEEDIAVILTNQETIDLLDESTSEDALTSVKPVVVVLSTEGSQEGLRKMIIKSIGVDLWNKE
jgi:V/A-type H+/Na+-transporting ATPase subunit F